MKRRAAHPRLARRRGFTLVEVMLATAVTTLILMALGSTMLLASKALPGPSHPLEARITAAAVLQQMAAEIETARYLTERGSRAITIVVADRDNDGRNETIRYAWSGTSGQGMTRSYNGLAAVEAIPDVRQFALSYTINTVSETYPNASGSMVSSSRYEVSDVRIALRSGDDANAKAETLVRCWNLPPCVTAAWDVDFSRSPTSLDTIGNGTADWVRRDGASFNAGSLSGGVWRADATLDTRPVNNFSTLTTVEARFRDTTVGGTGAIVWINADWSSGGAAIPIYATLSRQSNGTQTLTVYRRNSSSSTTTLVTVPNLSTGFVDLRLLIDPSRDLVNVKVNGMERGSYSYSRWTQPNTDKFVSLSYSGSTVEFDSVSIRVWSASP